MCLIVCSLFFEKKSFLDTKVVISSGIHQEFCKIPPLSITGHALRFDHFLKSTKIIQKKIKKNVKPSCCILIYVLVTIQNNKLGIRRISYKSLFKMSYRV